MTDSHCDSLESFAVDSKDKCLRPLLHDRFGGKHDLL